MNDPEQMLGSLIAELDEEFAGFRLVSKRGRPLQHAIDFALRMVTLGAQNRYLTHYHTMLGNTVFVPDRWEQTDAIHKVIVLRHERVHLRQRKRWGNVRMTLQYLFPYFPLGLAWGRARIEWEAYAETIRATAELLGIQAAEAGEFREYLVSQFTSAAYGWMWPFPGMVQKWYQQVLKSIKEPGSPGSAK